MSTVPPNIEIVIGRIIRRNIERALAFGCLLFGAILVLRPAIFDSRFYGLLENLISQQAFGLALFSLGVVRIVVLVVNGFWPVGPQVRFYLSVGSFIIAWLPFSLCFWGFALNVVLHDGPGAILPGVILAPICAWVEAMCAVALRAWIEALAAEQRHAA
ncbi:MAG: hypothetical protein KDA41_22400 [Planctomycetales bacterium]|nr:hypothetical protein [Planctomycetales bacterium]